MSRYSPKPAAPAPVVAPKINPLPADYVRPTLKQFQASGMKHVSYEEWHTRHEAELRRHYKPPAPPPPVPEITFEEGPELTGVQPSEPRENTPSEPAAGAPTETV